MKIGNIESQAEHQREHIILAKSSEVRKLIEALETHCAHKKRDKTAKRLLKQLDEGATCW